MDRVLWEWLRVLSETDLAPVPPLLGGMVRSARLSVLRENPTGLVGGLDMLVLDFMCLSPGFETCLVVVVPDVDAVVVAVVGGGGLVALLVFEGSLNSSWTLDLIGDDDSSDSSD